MTTGRINQVKWSWHATCGARMTLNWPNANTGVHWALICNSVSHFTEHATTVTHWSRASTATCTSHIANSTNRTNEITNIMTHTSARQTTSPKHQISALMLPTARKNCQPFNHYKQLTKSPHGITYAMKVAAATVYTEKHTHTMLSDALWHH